MKWWQLAFKILLSLRTPLIFPLDLRYFIVDSPTILEQAEELRKYYYTPDTFDCDDFAWIFKALQNMNQINSVGFVTGFAFGTMHAWNCAVCNDGVFQIEPQTGELFKYKKGYFPLLVII